MPTTTRQRRKAHKWTLQEMTVLCLLNQFFSLSSTNIVLIMGAYFSQSARSFSTNMVSARLSNIRRGDCLHEAHLVWRSLSTKTQAQLCQSHQNILNSLAQLARRLRVPFGQTKDIHSNRRRSQKIIQQKHLKHKHEPVKTIPAGTTRIASAVLIIRISRTDLNIEIPVTSASPFDYPLRSSPCPRLLFRAHSATSSGINTPELFRAGFYANVPTISDDPVGPAENPKSKNFLIDALNHLTRSQTGTRLISVTPSLIWVIFQAIKARAHESHFAIVDGPAAAFATNIFPVAPIVRDLKTLKWWPNCEYRASQEFFIWGEIGARAINCNISVVDLLRFSARRRKVRRFLRLHEFQACRTVIQLRIVFHGRTVLLDAEAGSAIAELLLLFGVTVASDEDVICTMIYCLLQGWVVCIRNDSRCAALQAFLDMFTTTSRSDLISNRSATIVTAKVTRAFNNAVDCALEALESETAFRLHKRGQPGYQ